jgi:hypothetical protein
MIVCVALIGQQVRERCVQKQKVPWLLLPMACHMMMHHAQNQPLFLRAFPASVEGEQLVKLHYIVQCSLDAVEEKGAFC